jgi:hypothetical protein
LHPCPILFARWPGPLPSLSRPFEFSFCRLVCDRWSLGVAADDSLLDNFFSSWLPLSCCH